MTIDGSTAPSAGQAKSVFGFTWRIVCTVLEATSVASFRWLREPVTSLPLCASDARSGSAKGRATTSLSLSATVFSSLSSHALATAWFLPAVVVSPFLIW